MRADPDRRTLGLPSLTLLVVASMVGAGVYTTSGFALADLGDPRLVLTAWVIGGGIALCGAHSYSQLAQRIQESGGEYVFLARGLHPAVGFLGGWVSLLAGFSGAAAFAAVAFAAYALPEGASPEWLPDTGLASLLVVVCTAAHAWRTETGARGQNVLVFTKLAFLAGFILVSLWLVSKWEGGEPLPPAAPPAEASLVLTFASSLMWISLSYSGFNAAVYVSEEARGGGTTVAAAMQIATFAVTILYLLLNTIFLFGPPADSIAGQVDIAAITAKFLAGGWFSWLTRIVICLSLASSVSACLLAGPRVYAKMAGDGLLPSILASHRAAPSTSVVLQGAIILVVIQFASLQSLLSYLGLTLSLFASLTVSTLFLIPRASTDAARSPGAPMAAWSQMVALIYIAATVLLAALAAYHRPHEAVATVVTLVSGVILYWLLSLRR